MLRDPVLIRLLGMLLQCAAGVAVALGGVWLFRKKRYRVRARGVPHCARCNYNLTGMEGFATPHCPECGADLHVVGAVLAGPRTGSPLAALGLLLIIVGMGGLSVGGYRVVRKTDWYHFASNGRVLRELWALPSATRGFQRPPYELYARVATGRLKPAEFDEFIEYLLQQQQAALPGTQQANCYVPWLSQYHEAGRLSPEQKRRYLAQACHVALRVRAQVPSGMAVPVEIEGASRVHGNLLLRRSAIAELLCDGAAAVLRPGQVLDTGELSGGPRVSLELAPLPPGAHRLKVRVRYALHALDPTTKRIATDPAYTGDAQVERGFVVLDTRPPQLVRPVTDPAFASDIIAFLQTLEWSAEYEPGGTWSLQVRSTRSREMPVNLAFEAEAFQGAWRAPLGRLDVPKNPWYFTTKLGALPPDLPAEFHVRFRPSEDVALSTPDMDEYWAVAQEIGPVRLSNAELYERVRQLSAGQAEPHEGSAGNRASPADKKSPAAP